MTIFDVQKSAGNPANSHSSDRTRILNNIKALYEDALGYELVQKQLPEKEQIVSLEQVMWSASNLEDTGTKPDAALENPPHVSIKDSKAEQEETHDDFDRLLFRLMKDMQRLEHVDNNIHPFRTETAHKGKSGLRDVSQSRPSANRPHIPFTRKGSAAPAEQHAIEDMPVRAESLPEAIREPLCELVYQQIEHRIKRWIDRNLEQIVQDALRYEETGSRDST